MHMMNRKIKVLIVDDSAIVRKILSDTILSEPDMEVVGTAPDPYIARDKILALRPDVLTLDIEMPRMDGLTFLKRLMRHHPIPTIIISSLGQASCSATLEALRWGAVDVLAKPAGPYSVSNLRHSIATKIRGAAAARPRIGLEMERKAQPAERPVPARRIVSSPGTVIAIGASTGGIAAIQDILLQLPADIPGMVITQHIPAGFSLAFANRLNKICSMEVREAVDGDALRSGLALIAPGGYHLVLRRSGGGYVVELQQGPPVCYQRPSVDVMFASVAQVAGSQAVGVLLTGMGTDGARGMLALKRAGAATIAQDEASCVVYGMPREAVRLEAIDTVASLSDIPRVLAETVGSM
ncbi:chemotaxis response regulator protein-glutamate methylesterase [Granulicella sp. dw_53]|uniref:protein-glutamate methylesterase/protein-glutamine glutaminase n=1 Tax=Granulicella sp. dw_53 TaxID=2719792 RepID=UPI002104CCA5|nr:chemotaxis response regulator protein-glutamate methylesterase [Granulicella sp. dw_53]